MTIFVVQTVLTNPGLLYTLSREPVVKLEKCHRVGAESLRIIIQYFQATLQIYTVFNCVHFPLQSDCTVYIFCRRQSKVEVTVKKL